MKLKAIDLDPEYNILCDDDNTGFSSLKECCQYQSKYLGTVNYSIKSINGSEFVETFYKGVNDSFCTIFFRKKDRNEVIRYIKSKRIDLL